MSIGLLKKQSNVIVSCSQRTVPTGHSIDELLDGPQRLVTLSSLLKRLGNACNSITGRNVHHHIVECGYGWESLLGNCLMNMYGKCALVEDAQAIFDKLQNRDTYSWNILLNIYGRHRSLSDATFIFDMMLSRDVVSWNAIIALLSMNGNDREAMDGFHYMQMQGIIPSDVTYIAALDACSVLSALRKGKEIHAMITNVGYDDRIVVITALLNMYGQCGCLKNARDVFVTLSSHDVVSWTAMIGCLTLNGCHEEALEYFEKMQAQGVVPNNITFIAAVEACANMASLEKGYQIHSQVVAVAYEKDTKVANALIDMYSKCGNMKCAKYVFHRNEKRTVVSWNALIVAYGQHGLGKESLSLFWQMHAEGIMPDNITFISMMNACGHNGLVEDGLYFFLKMYKDHGLDYVVDHYVCIIDLLGRAGQLDNAENVVKSIPLQNNIVAWLCLLAGCRIHGDVDRGSNAARKCIKLDPGHCASYVVLSNLYATLVF